MKLCDQCAKEIKQVVTNGNLFFCSYKCRDKFFREVVENRFKQLKAKFEGELQTAFTDIRGRIAELSKDWQLANTCEVCGRVIDEGLKYCSAACKQRAYRERKAANGDD